MFSGVNEAIVRLSNSGFPLKPVLAGVGAVLLLGLIVLTVTQCAEDEEEAPAPAGGAAMVERQLISDGVPDAYLVKPGVVDVEK